MILDIPHASTFIPTWIYDQVFLPKWEEGPLFRPLERKKRTNLDYELLMMTDWYTDELFDHGLCPAVKAKVSRLVCDTERFEDDALETMSRIGMGLCYTNGFDLNPIKSFSPEHREYILKNYYRQHHRRLEALVDQELEKKGRALILDCHSFSGIPLPYENKKTFPRPDICIGADEYHTPEWLKELAKEHFKNRGYTVSCNDPFSGSIVPLKHYGCDKRTLSIMVEVNRNLYLKEGSNLKNRNFKALKMQMRSLEEKLIRS